MYQSRKNKSSNHQQTRTVIPPILRASSIKRDLNMIIRLSALRIVCGALVAFLLSLTPLAVYALTAQTITAFTPATPILFSGGSTFTLSAAGGASGNPVVFSSGTTSICTVAGTTVTKIAIGTCTLRANQAGNATYSAAPQVSKNVVINKGTQTITFAALAGKSLGVAPFAVTASSSAGLSVTFASTTTSICTVSGATVTLVAIGTCTIAANQAGNTNYNAATQVSQSFSVLAATVKTNQTITFGAIANTALGSPLTLSAISATSGLTVVMTSATTTICTVSGFTVTLVATGTCTLRANQSGNTTYNAAPQVSQSFTVLTNTKTNQTITFVALSGDSLYFGGMALAGATATSGLTVVMTSGTPTVCTIAIDPNGGFYITYLTAGTCSIRANQSGNTTYNAAPQVTRSFTIAPNEITVSIASPLNNANVTAPANIPIVVNATTTAGTTITSIDYYRNNQKIASVSPSTPVTMSNLGVGTYTLQVFAYGSNARTYNSNSVIVNVTAPVYTVAITSPANGATFTASMTAPAAISFSATATSPTAGATIQRVDYYRGATLLGSATIAPYTFNWSSAPTGGHRITAVSIDSLGVSRTSAEIYVVVDSADTCINASPLAAGEASTQLAALSQLPITFEQNRGQIADAVKFQSRTAGFQLFLTEHERVMVMHKLIHKETATPARAKYDRALMAFNDATGKEASGKEASENAPSNTQADSATVRMRYVGAHPHPRISGAEVLEQRSHYLLGDDATQWRTDIRHFAKARYHDIYPGIDEIYYGKEGKLEYDLRVAPGANPHVLRFALTGADRISIDQHGDLLLDTPLGTLVQKKPVAYQEIEGVRHEVVAHYDRVGGNEIKFRLGAYDPAHELIIDPVIVYSTFLGASSGYSSATGVALSRCGEAYVVGVTRAPGFPTTTGALDTIGQPTLAAGQYIGFVSKLNATGTALVYSTYLGSNNPTDSGFSTTPMNVAVDATGHAYIAGETTSAYFPITPGSAFATPVSSTTGFVAKLNNAGSGLAYASYLPGDRVDALAVDSAGAAYVAGGHHVWKMKPSGASLDYDIVVGYAGTAGSPASTLDAVTALAVDAAGNAYVAGNVSRNLTVTAGAFQTTMPSVFDGYNLGLSGFVSKINPAGTGFVYSTYLGAATDTSVRGIALDAAGNAYVVGRITSYNAPANYVGATTIFNNNYNASAFDYGFAAKLNASGSQLNYFSVIGGGVCDAVRCTYGATVANAVAVDLAGRAWITGTSSATTIPLVNALPSFVGGTDFAAKLSPTGADLLYSMRLGDSSIAEGIAVDSIGSAYIVGSTSSVSFPTTSGSLQPTRGTGTGLSAYVLKINETKDSSTTLAVSPTAASAGGNITFTATVAGNTPTGTVTFFNGAVVLGTGTLLNGTATFTGQLAGGFYSALRAEYGGDANNRSSISINQSLTVNSPDAVPVVTVTSSIADGTNLVANTGDTLTGLSITVNANAAPGNLLTNVFVNIDGQITPYLLSRAVFSAQQSLPALALGVHTIYAEAVDNFNHVTRSMPIRFVVNSATATPPTVAITSPANNTTFTSTAPFTISAAATPVPGKTISQVWFYQGPFNIGSATSAPYNFNWNGVSAGTHSLTAVAIDSAGGRSISVPVIVTVNSQLGPLLAPTISSVAPGIGNALLYFRPPASTGGSAITGYSAVCTSPGLPPVNATAAASASYLSITGLLGPVYNCNLTASNSQGPGPAASVLVLPSPAAGTPSAAFISGAVPSVGSVTLTFTSPGSIGNSAITGYTAICRSSAQPDAFFSATAVATATTITVTGLVGGASYYCLVVASNAQGAGQANGIDITPTALAVGVSITTPTNNATYTAPASVPIAANITAASGLTIAQAEFYAGAIKLATLTSAPYTYTWSPAYAGAHALTVRVTDSAGGVTTSAAVNITVTSANAPTISFAAPAANASYTTPATVPLNITASGIAGATIARIEVYAGANLIASSNTTTLTTDWLTLNPGPQTLTARAIDSNGGVSAATVTLNITAAANETITFLHNDLAGSPMAATNLSGALVWKEDYRPFGERQQNEAAAGNQHQWFGGKPQDSETGLSYFGARYYDPVVGRFMGVDAVGFSTGNLQSFNRYAYGNNNPYRFVDPDGNDTQEVVDWIANRPAWFFGIPGRMWDRWTDPSKRLQNGPENAVAAGAAILGGVTLGAELGPVAPTTVNYSVIKNPPNVGPNKDFTARQKQEAVELNKTANGGVVKSDQSGVTLVKPEQSQKGVTPPANEWAIDHKIPKACGGTNCSSNIQVLSRQENGIKSDTVK
jgi:RHS repeat-associated protein